jgi:hypothetical protein
VTSGDRRARLATVELPDFGMPEREPVLAPATHAARLERLRVRADERGYTHLLVYADREHSANLAWLTGFDPRFEEAIAIVRPGVQPLVLAGNECYGTAGAAPLPMRRELYQDLSLPGQPRDRHESSKRSWRTRGSGQAPGSGSSAGSRSRTAPGSRSRPTSSTRFEPWRARAGSWRTPTTC